MAGEGEKGRRGCGDDGAVEGRYGGGLSIDDEGRGGGGEEESHGCYVCEAGAVVCGVGDSDG